MGKLRSGSVHHFNYVSLSFLHAYDFLVFTETPFFSEKKTFKIFILEICVKWYKYSRVEVAIAGKCKCVYLFQETFMEMHFPVVYECKNQDFSFCLYHGEACRRLYIKFQFFKYNSVRRLFLFTFPANLNVISSDQLFCS